MDVCCECCVLSGRGLCVGLITRLEDTYRPWRIVVCDLETSWLRRPWPTGGCWAKRNKIYSVLLVIQNSNEVYEFLLRHFCSVQVVLHHININTHTHTHNTAQNRRYMK
jgi:hypothetical protein